VITFVITSRVAFGGTSVLTSLITFGKTSVITFGKTSKKQIIMEMKWLIINKDDLPIGEVLAANFNSGTYGYKEKALGYLEEDNGMIVCDGAERLDNCTHYIDLDRFNNKF